MSGPEFKRIEGSKGFGFVFDRSGGERRASGFTRDELNEKAEAPYPMLERVRKGATVRCGSCPRLLPEGAAAICRDCRPEIAPDIFEPQSYPESEAVVAVRLAGLNECKRPEWRVRELEDALSVTEAEERRQSNNADHFHDYWQEAVEKLVCAQGDRDDFKRQVEALSVSLLEARQSLLEMHASEQRRLMGLPKTSPWKSLLADAVDHPSFGVGENDD